MRHKKFLVLLISMTYASIIFADVQTQTTVSTAVPDIVPTSTVTQPVTVVTTTTKDDSTPTPADEEIITVIYGKFNKTPALIGTALTASSLHGIVTINGTVTAQAQADAAIDAVKTIPGVQSVRSNITVTTNPNLNQPTPSSTAKY